MAQELSSTKPYMVRAIHEWCTDNALTPLLRVVVNARTKVPSAVVKDGEVVLNVNYVATKDLHIDNEAIVFSTRFGGKSENLYIPMDAVRGIFARENGQGMFFELGVQNALFAEEESAQPQADAAEEKKEAKSDKKRPNLTVVK